MRVAHRLLILIAALGLIACSDDSGTNPDTGPTTQATATIPPKGGSVTVESEGGAELKLTIPRGALMSATQVTLRAVDPPAGVKARFMVEPAGLDLNVPATFTVKLPDGTSVGSNLGLVFTNGEPVHVPATVDVISRTLTASLYQLGFDRLPGAAPAPAMSAALGGESNSFIDVDEMECQFLREALDNQILRAQAFSGPFPPDLASPIIQQYRASLLVCESDDSIAAAGALLKELACSNSSSATLQVDALNIQSAAELKQNLGFLLSAEALVQLTAADCHVPENSIETAFNEFIDAYVLRIHDDDFIANFPTWDSIWRELIPCLETRGLADAFELPSVTNKINQELLPALFGRLHEVATAACEEDENNSFLLDLAKGGHILNHPITPVPEFPAFTGFAQEDVVEELLTCGSSFTVQSKTSLNELLGTTEIASGDEGSVRVTTAGKVVIIDNTLGFTCSGGIVSRAPLRVRAEVPEHLPVVQLGNLSGSLTVNIPSTLSALPEEEPGEPADHFDIVIERDRNVCGIDEPGVIELARIRVDTQGFVGQMSGVWSGNCPENEVSGTFSVDILDNGDVAGGFGGSASGEIIGHVNSNGTFDATANGTAGSCQWTGSMNLNDGIVSGSGSWTCSGAGCSGTFQSGSGATARR